MATLAQIRSTVSRKVQDPNNTAISASVVNDEINRSVRFYEKYRFDFNEGLSTITLTSGNNVVPNLPSDLLSPLYVNALMVTDDQVRITLEKLSPTDFFDRNQDQTGRPYFYTIRNNEFLILPTPNEDYPLTFRYLKSYADLVSDTDTNDFTENAEDLIMLHTVKNLYAEDKQDPESAAYYQQLENTELRAIQEKSSDYNSTGYLSNYSILDNNYYY